MGFLDSLASGIENAVKRQYKSATGNDYDRDYRNYLNDYEYRSADDVRREWENLRDDAGIRHSAKKAAIKELMKEKGMKDELW